MTSCCSDECDHEAADWKRDDPKLESQQKVALTNNEHQQRKRECQKLIKLEGRFAREVADCSEKLKDQRKSSEKFQQFSPLHDCQFDDNEPH